MVVDLLNHFVSASSSGASSTVATGPPSPPSSGTSHSRRAHAEAGAPLALSSESLLSSDECILLGGGSRRADSPLDRVDLALLAHFGWRSVGVIPCELQPNHAFSCQCDSVIEHAHTDGTDTTSARRFKP